MTEADEQLRQFMSAMAQGRDNTSVPGYILREGRAFESAELNEAETRYIAMIDWLRREPKQCWYNCQLECIMLPELPGLTLRYVEGYLMTSLTAQIGIEHAWLSVNGKLVDPTVRVRKDGDKRVIGSIPEGWAYYGVEMHPHECRHALAHGESVSLIDDVMCGWPKIPERRARRSTPGKAAA